MQTQSMNCGSFVIHTENKHFTRDKEVYYIMIKESIQEERAIVNIHAPIGYTIGHIGTQCRKSSTFKYAIETSNHERRRLKIQDT